MTRCEGDSVLDGQRAVPLVANADVAAVGHVEVEGHVLVGQAVERNIVCFRGCAASKTRLTSLTSPVALIVPVPVSWLGDANSVPVVSVPPLAPKLIDPVPLLPGSCVADKRGQGPETAAPLVMFSVPLPDAPTSSPPVPVLPMPGRAWAVNGDRAGRTEPDRAGSAEGAAVGDSDRAAASAADIEAQGPQSEPDRQR